MASSKRKSLPAVARREIEPPKAFRKLYRPLGEIALIFADLEAQVTLAIMQILGTSWREAIAMEWLMQNFSMRIELFYFLARGASTWDENNVALSGDEIRAKNAMALLLKKSEEIYTDLKQANADRNNLLHGAWTGVSASDGSFSKDRLSASDGKLTEIPIKGITTALLKDEAKFIVALNYRLTDWSMRYRRRNLPHLWPSPLPDKYRLRSPLGALIRAHKKQVR